MATRARAQSRAKGVLNDYKNMRTLPAALSAAFVVASLYQFGGISTVDLSWFSYQLTTEHAVFVSLATYVAAFASSETKDFENYAQNEQIAIAVGPALIIGNEYWQAVNDLLLDIGDPLGMQVAFVVTVISLAVAVQ